MLPWPKELQERYPCQPERLPERPWWTLSGPIAERLDGLTVQRRFSGLSLPALSAAKYELPALIAQADETSPLPHPGFRVGQVWAFPVFDPHCDPVQHALLVVTIFSDTLNEDDRYLQFSDCLPWPTGPEDLFNAQAIRELYTLPSYLISDPCCPWLAPWSSPTLQEVK